MLGCRNLTFCVTFTLDELDGAPALPRGERNAAKHRVTHNFFQKLTTA